MNIIFKAIINHKYCDLPMTHTDLEIKGIYQQSNEDILGLNYKEKTNITEKESYFEIGYFLSKLIEGVPEFIELLFLPKNQILQISKVFHEIVHFNHVFLTKRSIEKFLTRALSYSTDYIITKDNLYLFQSIRTLEICKNLLEKNTNAFSMNNQFDFNRPHITDIIAQEVNLLYKQLNLSDLPDEVDKNFTHTLLLSIRNEYGSF